MQIHIKRMKINCLIPDMVKFVHERRIIDCVSVKIPRYLTSVFKYQLYTIISNKTHIIIYVVSLLFKRKQKQYIIVHVILLLENLLHIENLYSKLVICQHHYFYCTKIITILLCTFLRIICIFGITQKIRHLMW